MNAHLDYTDILNELKILYLNTIIEFLFSFKKKIPNNIYNKMETLRISKQI